MKKSKVLITGSSWFIGSAILDFLIKKKFKVYAILKDNKKRKVKAYKNFHLILYNTHLMVTQKI